MDCHSDDLQSSGLCEMKPYGIVRQYVPGTTEVDPISNPPIVKWDVDRGYCITIKLRCGSLQGRAVYAFKTMEEAESIQTLEDLLIYEPSSGSRNLYHDKSTNIVFDENGHKCGVVRSMCKDDSMVLEVVDVHRGPHRGTILICNMSEHVTPWMSAQFQWQFMTYDMMRTPLDSYSYGFMSPDMETPIMTSTQIEPVKEPVKEEPLQNRDRFVYDRIIKCLGLNTDDIMKIACSSNEEVTGLLVQRIKRLE